MERVSFSLQIDVMEVVSSAHLFGRKTPANKCASKLVCPATKDHSVSGDKND